MKNWISRNEAANMIGCSPQTISNYCDKGLIPTQRDTSGRVMVERKAVLKMLPDLSDLYEAGKKIEQEKQKIKASLAELEAKENEIRQAIGFVNNSFLSKLNSRLLDWLPEMDTLVLREKEILFSFSDGSTIKEVADIYDMDYNRVVHYANKAIKRLCCRVKRHYKTDEENKRLEEENRELRSKLGKYEDRLVELEDTMAINNTFKDLFNTKVDDLDISVRALNCLKAAEIETFGQLISMKKSDLLRYRNFGKKSLMELEELVRSKGFELGYDKVLPNEHD